MAADVSIIIPAYNEARFIEAVIRNVLATPIDKEVIVIDDGSTDSTYEILARLEEELPISLIRQPRNIGKGAAVRRGFEIATGDILMIQDADLEYNPDDYAVVTGPILRGEADVVIGSRFTRQSPRFFTANGDPFFSHFIGNKVIVWLTNLLYGFRATDYEGCYKAFRRDVIREVPVVANGFEFDNELVCKLLRRGQKIVEVPIQYSPRLYKDGKKIRWMDGLVIVWTIVKWRIWPMHSG